MQYVGKVGGYVYNQWNSLNPATLSGAIDIIVIEQPDGSLHCSPWHIRFGKFQIFKPSQKKIDLYVNDIKTDLPMKLGEGGEAFFVFETDNINDLSLSVLTSPVISPVTSAASSPDGSPRATPGPGDDVAKEPELLDLNADVESRINLSPTGTGDSIKGESPVPLHTQRLAFEKARKITQKLNIPSKIDINGDMVLDMDGYKPNAQKNIDTSDEFFKKIFFKEIQAKDENGNVRILNKDPANFSINGTELSLVDDLSSTEGLQSLEDVANNIENVAKNEYESAENASNKTYFKTLRLTSEQLQKMNLKYGENSLKFKSSEGTSQVLSNLYLWKSHTPIVISDIDGTITKSDALGHVLNLIGRDWTHPGVATLFQDIHANGYNIIYLTARSVGQADTTRQYLKGIAQDRGTRLPKGPVILSPDRTMAALKREIVLKKPEVFKMACLNDIKSLYFKSLPDSKEDDDRTPFYAGFGNRITDAISYRSVKIPSHRIFTINPNGEVHMELLELAGYKSSYLHIGELVDHFFPPIKEVSTLNTYWNNNQSYAGSPRLGQSSMFEDVKIDEKYNDVNYWREPINFSDLSDEEDANETAGSPRASPPSSPGLLSLRSFNSENKSENSSDLQLARDIIEQGRGRSKSASSGERPWATPDPDSSLITNESDFTGGEEDDDDDYTDDDDYEDDYEDDDLDEDDIDEQDLDEYDDEDLDYGDDAIPEDAK
ncbi:LNS2-domain-containing protein, partial [Suhomyces tanzawaensis NRRL Y-17324]